jgi:hypothetical protein
MPGAHGLSPAVHTRLPSGRTRPMTWPGWRDRELTPTSIMEAKVRETVDEEVVRAKVHQALDGPRHGRIFRRQPCPALAEVAASWRVTRSVTNGTCSPAAGASRGASGLMSGTVSRRVARAVVLRPAECPDSLPRPAMAAADADSGTACHQGAPWRLAQLSRVSQSGSVALRVTQSRCPPGSRQAGPKSSCPGFESQSPRLVRSRDMCDT